MSRQFLESELGGLTENIWSATCGLVLRRAQSLRASRSRPRTVQGAVRLSGAWEGALVVHASAPLAAMAAGAMFGCEPEDAGTAERQDAVGEITSMTGGNLKALLPEPSTVSPPSVVEGPDFAVGVPGVRMLTQLWFECRGEDLQVTLLQAAARPRSGRCG